MDNGVSMERARSGAGRSSAKLARIALMLSTALGLTLTLQRSPEVRSNAATGPATQPLPQLLSETGLYLAGTRRVDARNLEFAPQYPLWSDGATKRRWIRLPEGQPIDASDPDEFEFPVGTKLWKEFSFGRPVETRTLERLPDGSWRFASYVWDADGRDARLAEASGAKAVARVAPGVLHDVPSQSDCRACHEGRSNSILGFTALQLSPARDALAPHREAVAASSIDLPELVRRGLIVNLPERLLDAPPVIAGSSKRERALRGYLYANCSNCHNRRGPLASLGLDFDVSVTSEANSLRSTAVGQPSRFQPPGRSQALLLDPADPLASVVLFRMQSREPAFQMPPLGTQVVDTDGVQLLIQVLSQDLAHPANPNSLTQ